MSNRKNARHTRTKKQITLIAGSAAVAVVLLFLLFGSTTRSFPNLPTGIYLGEVSGLADSGPITLYVQRNEGTKRLLFLAFQDRWRPQAVDLVSQQKGDSDASGPFDPIRFRTQQGSFVFYGSGAGENYSGYFDSEDNRRGIWSLKKVSKSTTLPSSDTTSAPEREKRDRALSSWLEVQAQYRTLQDQLTRHKNDRVVKNERYAMLTKFLDQEGALKDRAEKKRVELQKEVDQAKADSEKTNTAVTSLLSEVGLLKRITKKGQAVELARKVTNRENKWYLVNWRSDEDRSGVEEFVGEGIQIDLKKVDAAFSRANELKALEREVAEERRKIQELEAGGQKEFGVEEPVEQQPPEPLKRKPRDKKQQEETLWDKLFG